ncbi:AP-4 complex accessory subunit tepsin-like isoform X2 [Tachypleus tridentatus]|uniref:AP-4 complex accessory subunit tepsin-like isoform X2 n=1 Tax=Tachypleus tridentatus TaxID=6853 RepID=UPI003FD09372
MWTALNKELAFLKLYPDLVRATSDAESSLPGHLYGVLNDICLGDDDANCQKLLEFLLSRLQHGSVYAKLKVLKLLGYLVQQGHPSFREGLQREEHYLKEAAACHGPPQPLYGIETYRLVRAEAKKLLVLLFDETEKDKYDDEPQISVGYGTSGVGGKLPGFGNTPAKQKIGAQQIVDGISVMMEKLTAGSTVSSPFDDRKDIVASLPRYQPVSVPTSLPPESNWLQDNLSRPVPKPRKLTQGHKPGRAGGGWDDDENSDEDVENKEPAEQGPSSNQSSISADSLERTEITSGEEWFEERSLVENFTSPSSAFPPKWLEILEVCKRCSTLNCERVIEFLVQKLSMKEENIQMRVLVLLEAILHRDLVLLNTFNKRTLPTIQDLQAESIQGPVQVKAKKLVEKDSLSNLPRGI